MSRFRYTYEPLTIIKLNHENELEAQNYVKIYPSKTSEALMDKHKLLVKKTPEGFVLLYKKQEEFEAQTVDEVFMIGDDEVTDKRIVGYASTMPDPTFSNWLPEVVDIDLEFYAIADKVYKNDTDWDDLALRDFVVYSASDLQGTVTTLIHKIYKTDTQLQTEVEKKRKIKQILTKFLNHKYYA